MNASETAVVIGAGPAGLTAALELLRRTDLRVEVLEATDAIGGISQTVVHNGNRIDIGGHRFFSKSDRVMDWWLEILPAEAGATAEIAYQGKSREVTLNGHALGPEAAAMMLRPRLSRIVHGGHFFDYPISLSPDTLRKLGMGRTARIGASYLRQRLRRKRPIETLEDFFIDRFGRELYATFFRDYTEKVWGVPCGEIPAEWGAQRVKGLSVTSAVLHFLRNVVGRDKTVGQKGTETSLIERFLYPRRGPGEMWEAVADEVRQRGGTIRMHTRADRLRLGAEAGRVAAVEAGGPEGRLTIENPALVVSTMPLRSLVASVDGPVPENVREVAGGLVYRDFLIVGLLMDRLAGARPGDPDWLRDNWIYIQEPGVRAGRLQVFNNWSPYMVEDDGRAWVGVEYFVDEGDDLWTMDDDALRTFAARELQDIGLADASEVRDSVVVRMPKAYPAYFGTYDRFDELRGWLDGVENLAPVGRNGMHRYNNQDHSMLSAMTVVDQWVAGSRDPEAVWAVNAEEEYHEEG